ncbi:MAG TPA: response regulator transcription factor [Clostridia bacterium]|nr:response regulator transcription factor [Clostridia bacterium]
MQTINVMIVDDNLSWSNNLSFFLNKESDIKVVGTANNKEEAIHLLNNSEVDIILMDLELTEGFFDGIDIIEEISLIHKKLKIIVLTSYSINDLVIKSISAGAVNYLEKKNFMEVPQTIRSVYFDDSPFQVLANIFIEFKKQLSLTQEELSVSKLTPEEKKVYELRIAGNSISQTSKTLFKTLDTVKKQSKSILKKFNVKRFEDLKKPK